MSDYIKPTFLAIPMAMICSKNGCPSTGLMSIDPPNASLLRTSDTIDNDPLIILPQDISTRSDKSFLYIYEPNSLLVFELNETAGLIIEFCKTKPTRLSEIVNFIQEKFEKVSDEVHGDIYGFLCNLKISGFNMSMN